LAESAGVAASTLYQRFLTRTALGSLQYQKQLHLHEARGLVLHELIDPHVAAQGVGYDNSAQFNREYRRLFGRFSACWPFQAECQYAPATSAAAE